MKRFIISTKSKKMILNSNLLFKLIIIIFVIAFTITSWLYLFEDEGLFNEYEEPNNSNEKEKFNIEDNDKKLSLFNLFKYKNLTYYLEKMHKMANTKIEAEDNKIWGEIKITEKKVNNLIKSIKDSKRLKEKDKNMLLPILYRWEKGDFSNCVEDHNILWERLGGTIGKAIDLRKEVYQDMKR